MAGSGVSSGIPRAKKGKTTSILNWILAAIVVTIVILGVAAIAAVLRDSNADSGKADSAPASDIEAPQIEDGTAIEIAAEVCDLSSNVGDDGSSISFDTPGEDDYGVGDELTAVACVMNELEVPDRVISRIDQTRALDGTLDATWDEYEAFWNYHPDEGMNLTIFEAE